MSASVVFVDPGGGDPLDSRRQAVQSSLGFPHQINQSLVSTIKELVVQIIWQVEIDVAAADRRAETRVPEMPQADLTRGR